ncbi:MAG: hypothetical protein K0U98_10640 [Deltaproteobacteria bacterium]|nr:hypothetical protein [Deltaproteobacteria bacterium]
MAKWVSLMLSCFFAALCLVPALADDGGGSDGSPRDGQLILQSAFESVALGHWQGEEGTVYFSSDATIPWVVRVELLVNGKRFMADVDYHQGALYLDGGSQILNEGDMKAILGAYRKIGVAEVAKEDQFALIFVYRSLGFLAESPRDFVHAPFWTTLPRIVNDGNGESYWVGIGGDATDGPTQPPGSSDDGCFSAPVCGGTGSGLSDSNPSVIRCVEHGFYYCSNWDYYPNGLLSGEEDVTSSAPAVPPSWSGAEAEQIPVWGGPEEGADNCAGLCGPGCNPAGDLIGGGGAWGLGCLIHDHCVWQANGGEANDWENSPFSFDCGAELHDGADDHYMPPGFCPGTGTVGGVGFWPQGWWVLHEPTFNVVSPARLPDSGALGLLPRECAAFVCAGVPPGAPFTCAQAYGYILDQCDGCNQDFFYDVTRGGTVPTVATFHSCGLLQCPGLLPGDPIGYQSCVNSDWIKGENSAIRSCILGGAPTVCSAPDCAADFCSYEYNAFLAAGAGSPEATLWNYCRIRCQDNGYCGSTTPQCSFRSCLETVCEDEEMEPDLACYVSEYGGSGNQSVSYFHRLCLENDGC